MAKAVAKAKRKKKSGLNMKTWAVSVTARDSSLRALDIVEVQKVLKFATLDLVKSPAILALAVRNGIRLAKKRN